MQEKSGGTSIGTGTGTGTDTGRDTDRGISGTDGTVGTGSTSNINGNEFAFGFGVVSRTKCVKC